MAEIKSDALHSRRFFPPIVSCEMFQVATSRLLLGILITEFRGLLQWNNRIGGRRVPIKRGGDAGDAAQLRSYLCGCAGLSAQSALDGACVFQLLTAT